MLQYIAQPGLASNQLVLPQFSSEPRFELEPFRTGLKFSSRSRQEEGGVNLFEPV
jgi:hypothetical protein